MSAVKKPLQTLVLNADCRPLSTWPLSLISAEDAIHAVYRDRVNIIETWDAVFRSPSTEIKVPKVVSLRHYAKIAAEPKFCRRSILLRDRFRCQYCGEKFPSNELTFDHFTPRANGGKTVWENILTACLTCNAKKAHHPAQRFMPRSHPRRPSTLELLKSGLEFLPNDLREDFGSWLYWESELER